MRTFVVSFNNLCSDSLLGLLDQLHKLDGDFIIRHGTSKHLQRIIANWARGSIRKNFLSIQVISFVCGCQWL